MRFVGRREELSLIAALADSPREGALLFVGDRGVGKSALIEAAASEHAGTVVRINAAEREWPLSGLSTVFAALGDERALEFGGRFRLPRGSGDHLYAAAHDLLALLRGLALPPTVLLVDDVDRMDDQSRSLLGSMLGRLTGTGIRFVGTVAPSAGGGVLSGLPQAQLEHLTIAESMELARDRVGPGAEPGLLQLVARGAEGHPGTLVDALSRLDAAQLRGNGALRIPLRGGLPSGGLELARLDALPARQRAVLERVACAPLTAAATAGGAGDDDLVADLADAGWLQIVGRDVRIRSPRVRATLYWGMSARTRRELHEQLAESSVDSDQRLWHRVCARPDGTGASALLSSAVSLARAGRIDAAVEFAERALAVPEVGPSGRRLALAGELLAQGEFELASRYAEYSFAPVAAEQDEDLTPTDQLAGALVRVEAEFLGFGRMPTAAVDAAAALHRDSEPSATVDLLVIAAAFHADRWEVERARSLLGQAGALTHAAPKAVAWAQLAGLYTDAVDGRPSSEPEPAQTTAAARELLVRAGVLAMRERYDEADHLYSVLLSRRPAPSRVVADAARFARARTALRSGRLGDALNALRAWERRARGRSPRACDLVLLGWLAYLEERTDDAREHLERAVDRTSRDPDRATCAVALGLAGEIALLEGDVERAVEHLALADAMAEPFENPALTRHLPDLVAAYAATGRETEAVAAAERLEALHARRPTRWSALAVGRASAILAPRDRATEAWDRVIAQFAPDELPYDRAKCLLGRIPTVQDPIRRWHAVAAARAGFEEAGARVAAQALDRLAVHRTANPLVAPVGVLTEDERAVVQLVQQGLRNKEIAAELFLSVRTVELRLTHIYRKLGARSRSHLTALLRLTPHP